MPLCRYRKQEVALRNYIATLTASCDELKQETDMIWEDLTSLHMLAWDALNCMQQPEGQKGRYVKSAHSGESVEVTHLKILQHRLFIAMDVDQNGVISQSDVTTWLDRHVRLGSLEREIARRQQLKHKPSRRGGRGPDGGNIGGETGQPVREWLQDKVWGLLREVFAPASHQPDWQVCCLAQCNSSCQQQAAVSYLVCLHSS